MESWAPGLVCTDSNFVFTENVVKINKNVDMVNVTLSEIPYINFSEKNPISVDARPLIIKLLPKVCDRSASYRSRNNFSQHVKVGICARDRKTFAKPMRELVRRLLDSIVFEVVIITDSVIFGVDEQDWPEVDAFISFYSNGFPLDKAISYAKLRGPFLVNDLEMQYILQDRIKVYELLKSVGVDIPRYAVLQRGAENDTDNTLVTEGEDCIYVDGEPFSRPFVEKPISAEDHNIYIYYPSHLGGGCQKLFRKVDNLSSTFSPEQGIRTEGSYIIEEFLATDGTDVKVYAVGRDYAHGEARKSPSLDGIVDRDEDGKEYRYPVMLSAYEKIVASKIAAVFKQMVCGFDLLRSKGRSCVCDVNGFSFVKKSKKYYDDCANILIELILKNTSPHLFIKRSSSSSALMHECDSTEVKKNNMLELRCVVGILRHADRTPKQKMKMVVSHPKFLTLFRKYGGNEEARVKLKSAKQLQHVLDITRELLRSYSRAELTENPSKLLQMKYVLEMYNNFAGINRKVQMKSFSDGRNKVLQYKFRGHRPHEALPETGSSLLLILKWGGEVTEFGLKQSEELGKAYRTLYPSDRKQIFITNQQKETVTTCKNFGLLRLHSTYRHDLKIYASDEGRVQLTAAAFTRGFLALESNNASVLVHLVNTDKAATQMLDYGNNAEFILQEVKAKLHDMLKIQRPLDCNDHKVFNPVKNQSLKRALTEINNPQEGCKKLYLLVRKITDQVTSLYESRKKKKVEFPLQVDEQESSDGSFLYHRETLYLMLRRWSKLEKDFMHFDGTFAISLIPDIYDCAKYDYLHNSHLELPALKELFYCSKVWASLVIPLEYGISAYERLNIGSNVCIRLIKKIKADIEFYTCSNETSHRLDTTQLHGTLVSSPERRVRSRLYFTSESHIHGLVNTLLYGGLFDKNDKLYKKASKVLSNIGEYDFLSQIVFMMYEDLNEEKDSDKRFHVEIYFSSGVKHTEIGSGLSDDEGKYGVNPLKNMSENEFISRKLSDRSSFGKLNKPEAFKTGSKKCDSTSDLSRNLSDFDCNDDCNYFLRRPVLENHKTTEIQVQTIPSVEPLRMLHKPISQSKISEFFDKLIESSGDK